MRTQDTDARSRRPGFTLIEMLVVITIIIILASLLVAFLPTVNDHKKARDGASIVQNTLLLAKQRALRDQLPRGVRLIRDSNNQGDPKYNQASTLQYIEQPEDFTGGTVTGPTGASNPYTFTFTGVDLWGGFGPPPPAGTADPTMWPVQPGDYLVIQQTNLYLIWNVGPSPTNPNQGGTVQAAGPTPPPASSTTAQYRIVRSPRPLLAEPPLELPQDVAIDLTGVGPYTVPPSPAITRSIIIYDPVGLPTIGTPAAVNLDIMFSASGSVVRQGNKAGKFILWVRDITKSDKEGDQILITVYTRTGLVAPQPIDATINPTTNDYQNPYTYTQDGRDSGE